MELVALVVVKLVEKEEAWKVVLVEIWIVKDEKWKEELVGEDEEEVEKELIEKVEEKIEYEVKEKELDAEEMWTE